MLAIFLIGIPLLVAYGIFYIVAVIIASVPAANGDFFRYPLTLRLIS